MSWVSTINVRQSHDRLDLHQAYPQTLECMKETWLAQEANADHDRWGCLITLSHMASAEWTEMIICLVDYKQGKRSLDFGWHEVAKRSQVVGHGSG